MKRVLRGLAVVAGLLLVLVVTLAAFRLPVLDSLRLLAQGAFGDRFGISRTLVKTGPLLLTALGMVVAWRARMYNIGGEGQFLLGGLFGAAIAKLMMGPLAGTPIVFQILVLAASCVGGGLWALLAGWLYVKRGVEVVISTILLNFVAIQLLSWAVSGPLQESERKLPLTDRVPPELMLAKFDRQMDAHVGLFIGLAAAIGLAIYLFGTQSGLRLRIVGESPSAARAQRIPAARVQLQAIALSGALCGLAGGIEFLGVSGLLGTSFSQNWGFLAIPVALLGALHPLGTVASALYFGALFAGSENLARFTAGGTTLVYVIQAAAVLGWVALQALLRRRNTESEE